MAGWLQNIPESMLAGIRWGKDNASVTVHYTDGEKIIYHLEPPGIDFFKGFTQINVKKQ